jgi:predicted amidophosphoribosyltransferase
MSEFDDEDTVPCPYCRADVYEDAVRCPSCGQYLSEEDAPSATPRWVYWTAVICLLVAVAWAFLGW